MPEDTQEINKSVQEVLVLICILILLTHIHSYTHSLNTHPQLYSGTKNVNFDLELTLCPYLVYASSEGSDNTAHLCISDKYQNLMIFYLILYIPVNNFSVMSGRLFLA